MLKTLIAGAVACASLIAAIAVAAPPQAALVQRADSLYQSRDWPGARSAYASLTQAEPDNGRWWYRLGYTQYQSKDYAHAVESWTRSEAIGHNPTVMYNLGVGYALLGKPDRAFEWLDKAAASGFGQESQLASDPDLASLHADPRWARTVAAVHAVAAPCESRAESHQFDFWIGRWAVTSKGTLVGHSEIQQILGQCVIFENWTGLQGGSGKSFNTYDPTNGTWRQFWVDDRGATTLFTDGHFANGVMRFSTTSKGASGKDVLGRLSFYDLDANHVRQWKERSVDGGATWTTDYDFTYERQP